LSAQPVPSCRDLAEGGVDALVGADVAGQDQRRAEALGQRADAAAERLAVIGEGEAGPLRRTGGGDPPGERALVGDPHHHAALALHQRAGARQGLAIGIGHGRASGVTGRRSVVAQARAHRQGALGGPADRRHIRAQR
jgi:hypothetical protein